VLQTDGNGPNRSATAAKSVRLLKWSSAQRLRHQCTNSRTRHAQTPTLTTSSRLGSVSFAIMITRLANTAPSGTLRRRLRHAARGMQGRARGAQRACLNALRTGLGLGGRTLNECRPSLRPADSSAQRGSSTGCGMQAGWAGYGASVPPVCRDTPHTARGEGPPPCICVAGSRNVPWRQSHTPGTVQPDSLAPAGSLPVLQGRSSPGAGGPWLGHLRGAASGQGMHVWERRALQHALRKAGPCRQAIRASLVALFYVLDLAGRVRNCK